MKSLPGTSSVHVKTAITPNFCTGTWACWTIRYCSRHSSVRCSALSVTCNSRMHFIEFDSNKLWCKFNTAEWKARVENPDHHKAISFDCTLPFQSAPSSFLLESNKDQNVWNYVSRIVFGGSSNAYGPRQLDDPWRPVPFAPTLRRCFPVPASGWFIWLERCIQRKSFAQTNKVFSDKMTRNDRNTSGHVIHTMAFIANNDKFTRCWLYHLECTHHITEIMKKNIWKLCLGSLSIQRRANLMSQTKWYRLTIVWFILKQHVVSGKHSPWKTSQPLTTYFLTFAVGPKKGTCIMCSLSELKWPGTFYLLSVKNAE